SALRVTLPGGPPLWVVSMVPPGSSVMLLAPPVVLMTRLAPLVSRLVTLPPEPISKLFIPPRVMVPLWNEFPPAKALSAGWAPRLKLAAFRAMLPELPADGLAISSATLELTWRVLI